MRPARSSHETILSLAEPDSMNVRARVADIGDPRKKGQFPTNAGMACLYPWRQTGSGGFKGACPIAGNLLLAKGGAGSPF